MTIYAKLTDILGTQTTRLASLIPTVINPQFLTDDDLTAHGVARVEVTRPAIDWWQTYTEPVIDTTVRPVTVTYPVEDLPLETVKSRAWERIKAERDERQAGMMPYTYPSGDTHHNEMTEKVIRDLSGSTTAAIALSGMGITDPVMPWTVQENITHILTPAQMVEFGLAALQWHSSLHMTSQTLRAQIAAAETVETVIAVQWPGV